MPSAPPRLFARASRPWFPVLVAAFIGASAATLAASSARAQSPWDTRFVEPAELTFVVGPRLMAMGLGAELWATPPTTALLTGSNGLDDLFAALVLADHDAREAAALASDVMLGLILAQPVLDATLALGLAGQDERSMRNLLLIDLQSYALTLLIVDALKNGVGRARPHLARCAPDDDDARCTAGDGLRSFPSGHAGMSFASAGLTCVSHAYLEPYGSAWGTALACGGALAAALTTSLLRVVAQRHHISDVLVGAVIGLLAGALLPALAHFDQP